MEWFDGDMSPRDRIRDFYFKNQDLIEENADLRLKLDRMETKLLQEMKKTKKMTKKMEGMQNKLELVKKIGIMVFFFILLVMYMKFV